MRKLVILSAVIAALPVLGQVMLSHRHAVATSSSGSIAPPTTDLAWHWVASDLTANSTVTNWVDRIQSASWSGPSGSTAPTNSSLGVFFNGSSSQVLTGSINVVQSAINTNVTMFVIMQRTSSGSFQTILSQNTGGNWVWEYIASTPKWHLSLSSLEKINFKDDAGTNAFDMAFSSYRTPSDNTTGYTNGVPCATNSAYIMSVPQTMTRLGGIPGEFFTGYIRELFIYTNKLADSQIATLHQYATNTYHYTP